MLADGPVFIAGLDASGKTPLRALLDRLENVTFIRRAYLWTELYGRYGRLDDDANWRACLAALATHPSLGLTSAELSAVTSLVTGQRSYLTLLGAVMEQIALRRGTTRWGVQEALAEVRADQLLSTYRGSRIIHLIRDPRDRYLAALHGQSASAWRLGVSVARWQTSARLALRNREYHADSYLVIRYEDLVAAPADTVLAACEFIGETPPPGLLAAAGAWAVQARPTVGLGAAGLPPAEMRFVQGRLSELMQAFGYEPVTSPAARHFRLGDVATVAVGSLAAWRWGDRDLHPETRRASARKLPA